MTTSPSDINELLLCAASAGAAADVSALLARGADPRHLNSASLFLAAKQGCAECVKLLMPHANPKANSSNALRWAASYGHAECVKLLIPVSDPKASSSRALRLAASKGAVECLRLLIPFSDLAAANYHALRIAIENDHIECANLLIEPCPLLRNPQPFHSAVACGDAKAVAFMLEREPALIDLVNPAKLIIDAAENGHPRLASLLLSIIESRAISSATFSAPSARSSTTRL